MNQSLALKNTGRQAASDATAHPQATARPSSGSLLRSRNLRLRLIGGTVSLLGDQFYMIALPWLVLQLTGNAFAVGSVLALAGIPRALFMLLGGALTDRLSPRTVMFYSNVFRAAIVGLMAGLVLTGSAQLWMLYAMALVFGLVDAFFYPAMQAIMPQIVAKEQLQAGNALMQGSLQVATFLGPMLAGAMIAVLDGGHDSGTPDRLGIGIAFAVDAVGFLFSAATLWMMRIESAGAAAGEAMGNVVAAIREGLAYVWHDTALCVFFLMVSGINLLFVGPFFVGVPVLADARFPEGAAAFGLVMSAWGGGSLLGIVLAGVLPKPKERLMATLMLGLTGAMGLGLAGLGLVQATYLAALVTVAMGGASGYVSITFVTWLQAHTPAALQGRVMSLLMFASVGLLPVSMAAAGALIDLHATLLFVGAGTLLALGAALAAFNPTVRSMGKLMAEQS